MLITEDRDLTALIGNWSSWGRIEKEGVGSVGISPVPGDGGCVIVYRMIQELRLAFSRRGVLEGFEWSVER